MLVAAFTCSCLYL